MAAMVDLHPRQLYLARRGEPTADGSALCDRGTRQATLLGERLAGVPIAGLHHGPLPRAAATARLVAAELPGVPVQELAAAGDYVPHVPGPDEVDPAYADAVRASLADVGRHELAHAFLIGWLVRHALDAPAWRWWGLNHCHAGITVIRYEPGRPPTLVVLNDVSYLPPDLRWTGFPSELRS